MRTPELEEADGQDDLPLGDLRDGVPQLLGREAIRHGVALRPREADAVGVHDEANERGHRDAAVLDLSLAQEANGRRVGVTPELATRKVERVPEADDRVERLGLGLRSRGAQTSWRSAVVSMMKCERRVVAAKCCDLVLLAA